MTQFIGTCNLVHANTLDALLSKTCKNMKQYVLMQNDYLIRCNRDKKGTSGQSKKM